MNFFFRTLGLRLISLLSIVRMQRMQKKKNLASVWVCCMEKDNLLFLCFSVGSSISLHFDARHHYAQLSSPAIMEIDGERLARYENNRVRVYTPIPG